MQQPNFYNPCVKKVNQENEMPGKAADGADCAHQTSTTAKAHVSTSTIYDHMEKHSCTPSLIQVGKTSAEGGLAASTGGEAFFCTSTRAGTINCARKDTVKKVLKKNNK